VSRSLVAIQSTKLPYGYNSNKPETNSEPATNFEYAASTYPELLAIARQPFVSHIQYPHPKIAGVIPPSSLPNFGWYFKDYIRSCTWWEIRDITTEDIVSIRNSDLNNEFGRIAQTSSMRGWLQYFIDIAPEQCNFNLNDINIIDLDINSGKAIGRAQYHINSGDEQFIPDEIRPQIKSWLKYLILWEKKLIEKNILTSNRKRRVINKLFMYFIIEIYPKSPHDVPFPKEFKRKHLDGWNGDIKGLLEFIHIGLSPRTHKQNLYNFKYFFTFMALYKDENGFDNILDLTIDAPFIRRCYGTNKVIFPSEYYAPFISYLYGLCEWVWFMINNCHSSIGQGYLSGVDSIREKRYWDTMDSGFVPIFWFEGKAIPIFAIPFSIAPISYRILKSNPNAYSRMIDPHYIHIATLLYETGIRLRHINWLDVRTYDQLVERNNFDPYSFDISTLCVNTDKVNGAWECHISQSVIGILDRQKYYQNFILNEKADTLLNYNKIDHSPYDKIMCLFYKGRALNNAGKSITVGPISQQSISKAVKKTLYSFNATCYEINNFEPFTALNVPNNSDIPLSDKMALFSILFNKENITNFKTDITPHSARSQVVTAHISLLPPSEIRKITGHATDAHVLYYAQINKLKLDKINKNASLSMLNPNSDISEVNIANIKAEDVNSKLRNAFEANRKATIHDFGATSFNIIRNDEFLSGINEIKNAPAELIAFNSTHICPFNNQCPPDVIQEFKSTYKKPCGRCFYAVKTVDHIPRILGKIRKLTDESLRLESYIKEAKIKGVALEILSDEISDRQFTTDELIGWSVSIHCLTQMANDLNRKDKWLIQKPEFLVQNFQKISPATHLESILARIKEAETYAEFYTPSLKSRVKLAQIKLLAFTGKFKEILDATPNEYTLIDEFRGLVKSICDVNNIEIRQLSELFDSPARNFHIPDQPLELLSNINK